MTAEKIQIDEIECVKCFKKTAQDYRGWENIIKYNSGGTIKESIIFSLCPDCISQFTIIKDLRYDLELAKQNLEEITEAIKTLTNFNK